MEPGTHEQRTSCGKAEKAENCTTPKLLGEAPRGIQANTLNTVWTKAVTKEPNKGASYEQHD